jgi:phosphoesterase RecJ-like protein
VDAVASTLGLMRILQAQGKTVEAAIDGFVPPETLSFLPGVAAVRPALRKLQNLTISLNVSKTKVDELSYAVRGETLEILLTPREGGWKPQDISTKTAPYRFDLVIVADAADPASLGALYEEHADFFSRTPTIAVGHDPGHERFGTVNLLDHTAAATCEVIYHALPHLGGTPDPELATCLLTGIIAKTKSFKTANITPRTLRVSSELIAAGARREDIVRHLFRTRSITTMRLWGRALARLKFDAACGLAWSLITRQDFALAGENETALPDVLEELISYSPEARVSVLLYEQAAGGICGIVRTDGRRSAAELGRLLGGTGGMETAQFCLLNKSLMDAEQAAISTIRTALSASR